MSNWFQKLFGHKCECDKPGCDCTSQDNSAPADASVTGAAPVATPSPAPDMSAPVSQPSDMEKPQ
jgi:hypothetical protein